MATVDEVRTACDAKGGVSCVLEKKFALQLEVSVIVARTRPVK